MKQTISRLMIISMIVVPLGACGGKKKRQPPPPPAVVTPTPPPVGANFEDQFGAGFGKFFRAAAWSEPGDPQAGDVIPISFSSEPVNF